MKGPSDTEIPHGRSADRIIKKSNDQDIKKSNRARQSMVILKKLQEFIGNKESSDVNRFGNKRRAHENHMVAFGQEIESIMSGKQTGSPSLSQKSLTKREQDTEEENPETQPVQ